MGGRNIDYYYKTGKNEELLVFLHYIEDSALSMIYSDKLDKCLLVFVI